jgi:hypothetical protein
MPVNDFYEPTGNPGTRASLSSAAMRAEFAAIDAGFDKMPDLDVGGDLPIFTNAGATALEPKSIEDALDLLGGATGEVLVQDATTPFFNLTTKNVRLERTTFTAQEGIVYKDTTRWLHDFNYGDNGVVTTEGGNISLGEDAGNFTTGGTATQTYHASHNIHIGRQAGISTTTAFNTVSIGDRAGRSNTTGQYNTFAGSGSGFSNTSGHSNAFFGTSAGGANTVARYNSFIGPGAGYYNVTGEYNTYLGRNAGNLVTGGAQNTNNTRCVHVGNDTYSSSSSATNEIVIGDQAIGSGSNTATIGNTSITRVVINGTSEIQDDIKLLSATFASQKGIIFKDTTRWLHDFNYGDNGVVTTEGRNISLGEDAGNFTMGSTATIASQASYNVFVGYKSGNAATTMNKNVNVGAYSGQVMTTGASVVNVGHEAGNAMTTGSRATNIGYRAGFSATTSSNYTNIGALAGSNISSASLSICLGFSAASFLADGVTPLTSTTDSVFLGAQARSAADGQTNEIVIGKGAIGSGTNTATIGNTSLTRTVFNGTGDFSGNLIRVRTQKTPASAVDTGSAGEWCNDASYLYVCTATDTWKRAALASW